MIKVTINVPDYLGDIPDDKLKKLIEACVKSQSINITNAAELNGWRKKEKKEIDKRKKVRLSNLYAKRVKKENFRFNQAQKLSRATILTLIDSMNNHDRTSVNMKDDNMETLVNYVSNSFCFEVLRQDGNEFYFTSEFLNKVNEPPRAQAGQPGERT